ncbi:hypothetical protein ACFL3D_05615 [Candidatus Omnitrophota bacterium]
MGQDILRFFTKATIFILLCVIILCQLNDYYLSAWDSNMFSEFDQSVYLSSHVEKGMITFWGDSHVVFGINTTLIKNAISFAENSESIAGTLEKIRFNLNKDTHIKAIVLPYNLHMFTGYDWEYSLDDFTENDYISITDATPTPISLPTKKKLLWDLIPVLGKGDKLLSNVIKQSRGIDKKTLEAIKNKEPERVYPIEKVKERINIQFPYSNKPINKHFLTCFLQIIKLAEAKEIPVILIKYPIGSFYLKVLREMKGITPENFYDVVDTYLVDFRNIIVWDYQQGFLSDTFLPDYEHITDDGKQLFSREIQKALEKRGYF